VISDFSYSLFTVVVGAGDPNPTPSGGLESVAPVIDPNTVTPGMWGFISFVALILAALILYFSLRKQLKRVAFPDDPTNEAATGSETESGPRDTSQP
jgi:hypothetical protein